MHRNNIFATTLIWFIGILGWVLLITLWLIELLSFHAIRSTVSAFSLIGLWALFVLSCIIIWDCLRKCRLDGRDDIYITLSRLVQ